MRRREVSTQIRLKCGRLETVQADTYVWNDDVYGLCAAWDPERFIQGPGLRSLSTCAKDWTTEERELASTMRIDYVLPGDILCSHVLKNQPDRVASLLFKSRVDPDAPCRVFGTALQAAASLGDDDVVNLLLDYGADADGRGGRFGSPLMASAVGSRKAVTKILLKERADIFVDGGRYVSPLYQAVGHSDWAIAQLLLDNGAWLYEGYEELLDLAAEMRDSDMKRLLVDYDVQNIHRRLPAYANIPLRSSGVRNTSGSLGGVVLISPQGMESGL
ncbi:uncharacterized protein K452DRAFT_307490 [Neofusicoccum parvum]|nr:uncharacterized protein K452DRAFT_307490 [Neofusicoccum parvum]